MFPFAASIPVTSAPSLARDSHRIPPPHPTSRIRRPARGCAGPRSPAAPTLVAEVVIDSPAMSLTPVPGSIPPSKCRARASRMNPTRVGFIAWRGANGPRSSSHHRAASASNLAVSRGSTVNIFTSSGSTPDEDAPAAPRRPNLASASSPRATHDGSMDSAPGSATGACRDSSRTAPSVTRRNDM